MYPFHPASAVVAESWLIHAFGVVFHPIFVAIATVLVGLYGLTGSYGIAIIVLTAVIMALLMPLTITSTRSMMALQQIQPKIIRLRERYAGPENRDQLNHALIRLYKEEGIKPAGSCLPVLLQMPVVIVLYDVIKGLSNTLITMVGGHLGVVAQPRYIPATSRLYHDLAAGHGAMNWFGFNLAANPLSFHGQWFGVLPYLALIVIAVALQYVQMTRMRTRNPVAAGAAPQLQSIQRFLPLLFVYVYFVVPGAVVLYMIVSTTIRIGAQGFVLRHGHTGPPPVGEGPGT